MADNDRAVPRPPLGIAFEGDITGRADALLAIAMLNGFTAKGEARRVSLGISRSSLKTAQLADVIAEFYPTLPINYGVSTIGMPDAGRPVDDPPWISTLLSQTGPDGAPLYATHVQRLVDTADDGILIRNTLVAQHDGNAAIVVAGPLTSLIRLLDLAGSRPLILAKVRYLVVAAGAFSAGPADAAIQSDVAAARRLFAEWPTPVIAVGAEVGRALAYPGASLEKDLAWSPAHPVGAAYRARERMPYSAPTSALAAVLHAVHPDGGYFKVSEPGVISVLDDGRTRFTPSKDGKNSYLIADPAQNERLSSLYAALVSAQPAPRPVKRKRDLAVLPPEPGAAGQPGAVVQPGVSTQPGAPAQPATPGQPVASPQPAAPAAPATPPAPAVPSGVKTP